jgi:nucleotide-binding universal stress UspA family protein
MYKKILVTLDHSAVDEAIICHIENLHTHIPAQVVLLHVADGWVARNYEQLQLRDSEEIQSDKAYLEEVATRLRSKDISVETHLAMGEPANEIIKFAKETGCDLIAMSTHGHRFLEDIFFGSTATKVRHSVNIPILLIKAAKPH